MELESLIPEKYLSEVKAPTKTIPAFIQQYVKKSLKEFDYPLQAEIYGNKIGAVYPKQGKGSLYLIQVDTLPDGKISIDTTDETEEPIGKAKIFKITDKNGILKYIEKCLVHITEELLDDIGASEW